MARGGRGRGQRRGLDPEGIPPGRRGGGGGGEGSYVIPATRARMADPDETSSGSSSSSFSLSLIQVDLSNYDLDLSNCDFDLSNSPLDVSFDIPEESGFLKIPKTSAVFDKFLIRSTLLSSSCNNPFFIKTELLVSSVGKASALSAHISGEFGAFISSSGLVHVFNYLSKNDLVVDQTVIKDVSDVAFARIFSRIVLAAVDSGGKVVILEVGQALEESATLLEIVTEDRNVGGKCSLAWCPYVPASEEDDDCSGSLVLAVAQDRFADVYNVQRIMETRKTGDRIDVGGITRGHVRIILQSPINLVDLSLDCGALAFSAKDGRVYFYDYDVDGCDRTPTSIYNWHPKADEVPTSVWFLDDKTQKFQPDASGWRFAVVGSRGNSMLSLWCCEDWSRIQTCQISMKTEQAEEKTEDHFLSAIDPGGRFLVLAHSSSPVLFIISFDFFRSRAGFQGVQFASVRRVALPFTVISFAIRNSNQPDLVDGGGDDNMTSCSGDAVEMFAAHEGGIAHCRFSLREGDDALVSSPVPAAITRTEMVQKIIDSKGETDEINVGSESEVATEVMDSGLATEDTVGAANVVEGGGSITTSADTARIVGDVTAELAKLKCSIEGWKVDVDEEQLHEVIAWTKCEFSTEVTQRLEKMEVAMVERYRRTLTDTLAGTISRVVRDALSLEFDAFAEEVLERGAEEIQEAVVKEVEASFRRNILPDMMKTLEDLLGEINIEKGCPVKKSVKILVEQGRLDEALSTSLALDDSEFVLETCRDLDLPLLLGYGQQEVFTTETLLATLGFLGKDLGRHTAAKTQYLKDVLASIDLDEPEVRKELRKIQDVLLQQIDGALDRSRENNVESNVVKDLRILQMICQKKESQG